MWWRSVVVKHFYTDQYGYGPLKLTRRHGHFLNYVGTWSIVTCDRDSKIITTGDIQISLIRQGTSGKISDNDMQHCHFWKSTCDIRSPTKSPTSNPRPTFSDHVTLTAGMVWSKRVSILNNDTSSKEMSANSKPKMLLVQQKRGTPVHRETFFSYKIGRFTYT